MTSTPQPPRAISAVRLAVGASVTGTLLYTYVIGIPRQGASLVDYFGYFTNLTSLLTSAILMVTSLISLRAKAVPSALTSARAVAVSCMIIVGVVYNVLVPGTGSAPPWVSATLHTVLPILLTLDWIFVGDRSPLSWRHLWVVLPYPVAWLGVVLVRGATDGWVPYGFLLPERGVASLAAHVAGLLVALLASGALVWALSRVRLPRPTPRVTRAGRSSASLARPPVSPRERGGDPTVA